MIEKLKFGVVEVKGDDIFFNLKSFDTFEEAEDYRKSRIIFRTKNELIILRRYERK